MVGQQNQIFSITIHKGATISSSNPFIIPWTKRNPPGSIVISNSNATLNDEEPPPSFEWYYDATKKEIRILKVFGIIKSETSVTYTLECKDI